MLHRNRFRPRKSQRDQARLAFRTRLGVEALENRIVLDSTVVFNEIMYNPPTASDESAEWIELYNQLTVDMDISQWQLDGGVEFTFPEGTTVPGRGFLLVAASPDDVEAANGVTNVQGPYSGLLSNGGEEIRLYNNDGRLMNSIDYGDGGKWPVAPDGSGATLAKWDELTASETHTNWTSSTKVNGTPGATNFVESDGGGTANLVNILPEGAAASAFVPANDSLGIGWTEVGFDDNGWLSGTAGVGYEQGSGYQQLIGLDLEGPMAGVNTSVYMRVDFTASTDPDEMESLVLQMKYDDGFVAYLNGIEVARANAPNNATWNSEATSLHDDGEAVTFQNFSITGNKNLLNAGGNVLAIHGLNDNIGSSDMLVSPAIGYVPVSNGQSADGSIPLVINEVSPLEANKFIEIANLGETAIDLEGMVLRATGLTGGDFIFPAQFIESGSKLVLTEGELGMTMEDNERFFLYSADQATVIDARPITGRLRGRTDGGQWLYPDLPTPTTENVFNLNEDVVINEIMYHAQPQLATANTSYADSTEEWIELFNRGDTAIDLTGWELHDAVRFDFADGTVLQPGGYLVVARDPTALGQKFPGIDITGPFSGTLSNSADRILLVDASANPADEVQYFESGQWDSYADGGGSSLELKDPFANNAIGGSWAASDETSKSQWQTYSISKVSSEPLSLAALYHEFVFGLLDAGEILIDNLSLTRGGTQLISNGSFQSDPIGSSPSGWRLIGTHSGIVQTDPDDASNHVLHLVAAGAQQHIHDHVEITFAGGNRILDGQTHTLTFDAKWLAGSRQLNNRLYFTRAGNTIVLDAPQNNGTPGAQNSQFVDNIGPTYSDFGHAPVLPNASEPVTVTVNADDPQGVSSMTLFYNNNGGAWTQRPMSLAGSVYSATIPGQSSGQVVQFYVQGVDGQGAVSTFPATGPESRALYQVNDGQSTSRPIESFRVVLIGSDNSRLFSDVNRMSNNYVGGTLIVGGDRAFYDVGVRQVGSRWIRPNSGYKIKMNADDLYMGVHESLRFDINGLTEILFKQMVNRAGGSEVSMYDDISYLVTPQHSGRTMLLNLARYESVYLREQFENGTEGTKFELDDITFPTNPNGQGYKTGTDVSPQDIRYRGTDPEAYRGQLLIKNNRAKDDFAPLAEFARVINLNGAALNNAIDDVMDVDIWMRHYATQAFLGNWDTYGFSRPKNLRLYIRPDDGKVIPLYWDADLANLTDSLIYNGGQTRLDEIRNLPRVSRLFWGNMWDLTNRSFNGNYTSYWANHYNSLGAGTAGLQGQIINRAAQARSQAVSAIPMVNFHITSNNGNPITTNNTLVTLAGDGWIDVREVKLFGSNVPLNVTWTDQNSWTIDIPLNLGQNNLTLEAFDYEGNLVGSDSITVTSTATQPPVRDLLRITEINYNPAGADETEFIELMHTGDSGSNISLTGVRFTDGIDFDFTGSAVTTLAPGERVVVVKNLAAFEATYGQGINVAGTFIGSLANEGESITLIDNVGANVHFFSYNDSWYPETDGGGFTLTVVDPSQDIGQWDHSGGWRISEHTGGSPGVVDNGLLPNAIVVNEISNNDSAPSGNWIELQNRTDEPIDISGWYLSDEALSPMKYQFAAGSSIIPGGFLVLDENITFGDDAASGVNASFGLSQLGGVLWLHSSDENGEITGYELRRSYGAAEPDATQGIVQTSDGLKFATLTGDTRGAANQGPVIGPIVVNEINYNPSADGKEFIEIFNVGGIDITLNDGAGQAWQFVNGINYMFPAAEVLPANGFALLIEGGDGGNAQQVASDFRSANNVPAEVAIYVYEPTANGVLDNGGEELSLARPSTLGAATIVVDEIDYDDDFPWPAAPDGNGPSLSKITPNPFGNEPSNWGTGSSGGTPGRPNVLLDVTPPTDPSDLKARPISGTQVALAWTGSVDDDSGVGHYIIYRDGEQIETSSVPFFVDENVAFESDSVSYQVSAVNTDNIESAGRTNTASVGSETITFQQGTDGYSGATDAEIRENNPNSNNGLTDQSLEVDGEDSGGELAVLLRWSNVSVPANRTVVGASFSINVTNGGNSYDISRVLRHWEEDAVTWNAAQNGQSWQSPGAKGNSDSGPVVGAISGATGFNSTTLNAQGVAMVQEWIEDPVSNHGILLANPGGATDGVDFDSRETPNASTRPLLSLLVSAEPIPLTAGDFTLDDTIDADDLNIMCQAIRGGSTTSAFDLDNSGGAANLDDLNALLTSLGTVFGDANLDGRVDSVDLNQVGIHWQQTGLDIGWAQGDFTCNGQVDAVDLNELGLNWQFGVPAAADVPRAPLAVGMPTVHAVLTDVALAENARPTSKSPGGTLIDGAREQSSFVENDATTPVPTKVRRHVRIARRTPTDKSSVDTAAKLTDELFRRFEL